MAAKGARGDRFGIMNHVGSIWTIETFDAESEAQAYLDQRREEWARKGWGDLSKHRVVPVRVAANIANRIAAPPPPADTAMREAVRGLVEIVEGRKGSVEHGTWRNDLGLRLKDAAEWVALYLAHNATLSRRDAAEGRG